MIDWLYRASLEVSLLIGLVLVLRPIVRHQLGAHIAYWLWAIPLARCFIWSKPELPAAIMEKTIMANGETFLRVFPNPDSLVIPASVPLEWIWLTGFCFWVVARIIGGRQLQVCLHENSEPLELPSFLQTFLESKVRSKSVRCFSTSIQSAPFVTGLIKSSIYLPEEFFTQYNQHQQKCILDHELTHLKRKDLWLQAIGETARAIFWFNPVIHIAWSAFREDQELACDQQVLRHSNDLERYEYGRALVKGLHAHILPATLAFFSTKKERFIMLEKHKNSMMHNALGITLCLFIGVLSLTKAPKVVAHNTASSGEKIFLHYEDIPLGSLVNQIFEFAEKEVVGINLLVNKLVTIDINNVEALDAANVILKCNGFNMENQGEYYKIIQFLDVEATNSKGCIATELK